MTFLLKCVHIIFSSASVAEWPPFRKKLLEILVISRFGFEGWIWVLIASVHGLCILLVIYM